MLLDGHTPTAITQAAHALQTGALIGLPTETVYGLAANADHPQAVADIFARKGRPADHPLIVHLAAPTDSNPAQPHPDTPPPPVRHYAREVPQFALALMHAFWPGPLTLILARRPGVADAASGGQPSIGLRCPAHPVAQALLHACAQLSPPIHGLAAPSANRFGRISPTQAHHVEQELGSALLVLDGGPCPVGIESTIIDCTRGQPVLLRPGSITRQQIEAACGQPVLLKDELTAQAPRASGTLLAHYAPQAKLRLMPAAQLQAALDLLGNNPAHLAPIALYARSPLRCPAHTQLHTMPSDPQDAARQLFATLRNLDQPGTRLIWVETPPPTPDWDAVRDRLERAAAAG